MNHFVLVGASAGVHSGRRASTNPNQRHDCANGSEDLLCGGGFDRIPVQYINLVVDVRYLGPARARCHYYRLDVRAVESREYWWLYGGDW